MEGHYADAVMLVHVWCVFEGGGVGVSLLNDLPRVHCCMWSRLNGMRMHTCTFWPLQLVPATYSMCR